MKLIPDGERFIYVTRRQNGDRPPGSLCLAWRENGVLRLEFTDGVVIDVPGHLEEIEEVTREEAERLDRAALRILLGVHFLDDY